MRKRKFSEAQRLDILAKHDAGTKIADLCRERAATMYSFFASCKEHDVNPRDWLHDVLERIGSHKVNQLEELLPGRWAKK